MRSLATTATFVKEAWYLAAWSREVENVPLGRQLLGQPVVLFRDASGKPRALHARCPHRGADLSRGHCVDGQLECPFHGWRWDGEGQCRLIPSQKAGTRIRSNATVRSFPLRERDGLLWIWLGDPLATTTRLPGEALLDRVTQESSSEAILATPRLEHARFLDVLENSLDETHPAFVHLRTFGPWEPKQVPRRTILQDADDRGFRVERNPEDPGEPPVDLGRAPLLSRLVYPVEPSTESYHGFELGGLVYFYFASASGTAQLHYISATPADAENSWLFYAVIRPRTGLLQRWYTRRWLDRTNDEDVELLESLMEGEPSAPEISVEADRPSLALRRLIQHWLRRRTEQMGATQSQ